MVQLTCCSQTFQPQLLVILSEIHSTFQAWVQFVVFSESKQTEISITFPPFQIVWTWNQTENTLDLTFNPFVSCIWPPPKEVQACVRIRSEVGLRSASPGSTQVPNRAMFALQGWSQTRAPGCQYQPVHSSLSASSRQSRRRCGPPAEHRILLLNGWRWQLQSQFFKTDLTLESKTV